MRSSKGTGKGKGKGSRDGRTKQAEQVEQVKQPKHPEEFLIPKPVKSLGNFEQGFIKGVLWELEDGRPVIWSSQSIPLPNIGDHVEIRINGVGEGVVHGYFISWGGEDIGWFLGVMTEALRPPEWLRKQIGESRRDKSRPEWYRAGWGCEFAVEIGLWPKPTGEKSSRKGEE